MLGRLLIVDNDLTSRFLMKARLGAANHQVRTAANVTEAVKSGAGINAVLLRNPDSAALTRDISALRRRMAVPVIAICDAAQRQAAFRAGAQHVLESDCHDSVLRARLRRWMTRRAPTEPGFAEPMADFQPPQQIALISSDAGLSSEWRCAVSRATGRGLLLLPPRALNGALPDDLAAVTQTLDAAVRSGEDFETAYRFVHPDGTVVHVLARGHFVDNGHGPRSRMIGAMAWATAREVAPAPVWKRKPSCSRPEQAISCAVRSAMA